MDNPGFSELLLQLQETEFIVTDLQLFLDTHPDDKDALKQFNRFAKELEKLKAEYEARFGPLLNFGFSQSRNLWKWVDGPWPWQVTSEVNRRCGFTKKFCNSPLR